MRSSPTPAFAPSACLRIERACRSGMSVMMSLAVQKSSARWRGAHSTIPTQVTRADDTETCFQWFWKEVQWLEDHPRHATSLLLMTNPYWASNFDAFEQFGDALTQALQSATESKVEGLGFEGQIQLVFFHPQYVFR